MSLEINAPTFPESVVEGTIATWHKKAGAKVQRDELLADIETDKVVLEVLAPEDGVLESIVKQQGETVASGEPIAIFLAGGVTTAEKKDKETKPKKAQQPAAKKTAAKVADRTAVSGPAARKLLKEQGLEADTIPASGKGGRITKADVNAFIAKEEIVQPADQGTATQLDIYGGTYERHEKRVPMTRLRSSIAERLVQAQHEAAMLTTFNEVSMQPIMDLRASYREKFEKVHKGVRLGFMGFFVRAAAEALKRFPSVNASLDGKDIVYHGYQDIGVAVSTERGLIVPVIRHVEHLSIAKIEAAIRDFGVRARDNKIQIDELQGGTFTITNGGVYGSLMSTPILNPPQTGILGMHTIKERPVVEKGQVVIRPMMYLALSYDHRVIDGSEAVQFLVAIKDMIEDPARIILEL